MTSTNSASSSNSEASASASRSFHARANSAGMSSGDRGAVRGSCSTRPSAVEPHELRAVLVQDVGGDDALGSAFRQHHDHESTGTNILDVMRQVLELFEIKGANQRPVKLREESVRGAGRIETLEILSSCRMSTSSRPNPARSNASMASFALPSSPTVPTTRLVGYGMKSCVSAHCFHSHDPAQRFGRIQRRRGHRDVLTAQVVSEERFQPGVQEIRTRRARRRRGRRLS